ncbi:MAG: amidohydrolase family protein [Clostridia bacterium]|nr:amidohydrolase family protein [Clostridia bacterium]
MAKIDMHLHLSRYQFPKLPKINVTSAKNMIPHLDELGIEKGVLMSLGERGRLIGSNSQNRAICQKYPSRYAWMCTVDDKHPEPLYDRLAKYRKQGAVGIGELMINRRLDDPFMLALFNAAERLELPVTMHMTPEVGYNYGVVDNPGLPLLEEVLKNHPRLKILGHSQTFWIEISGDAPTDREGRSRWGEGPILPGGRLFELFAKYPNLYGDLSANSGGRAIMRDPDVGIQFLERFSDQLFFATDMDNKNLVFPLGGWLDEQAASGKLSQDAYEKICAGNARRVFGL